MSDQRTKLNPLIAAAAVAVIIFSAVGIGVTSGLIPGARSSTDALSVAGSGEPGSRGASPTEPQQPPAASSSRKRGQQSGNPAQRNDQLASNGGSAQTAPRVCRQCGRVDSINVVEKKGTGTGVGAVGGAVVGGLLGHQVGSGRGNTAATVIGAAGGAYAGHEVEKHIKTESEYHVNVRTEDGRMHRFVFDSAPGFGVGEPVRVVDGRLVRG